MTPTTVDAKIVAAAANASFCLSKNSIFSSTYTGLVCLVVFTVHRIE